MARVRTDGVVVYGPSPADALAPEMGEAYAELAALLAGCAVRGIAVDAALVDWADVDALLDVAARHQLTAAVAFALESSGLGCERTSKEFAHGVWRGAQLEGDWERVRTALEQAGIWHCPLKGASIKGLYPVGLRQMCDYDVLFDATRADDVREALEGLGFETQSFGAGNHDVYYRRPVTNFEMHRMLFGPGQDPLLVAYYKDVSERLVKDEGCSYGYHMDATEEYLYLVAHAYKHHAAGGTGLRSLLDIYVYASRRTSLIDWDRVSSDAEALGIGGFEHTMRGLATRLYEGERLTADDRRELSYILASGAYGTLEHSVSNSVASLGGGRLGKVRYVAQRLMPPMEGLESAYPLLASHRWLAPALMAWRVGRALTVRRTAVAAELSALLGLRKA